ncbi:MAG TPA: amidase [Protaetiibacter sp.]|nr:amidase [Protaetiibacter sp.]
MTQLHDLTAYEQLGALRAGEISSRELTEHYLDRIETHADSLGAFVTLTPEFARASAARADERLAQGDRTPLLGLPIGIKDLQPTAGIRTTFGSAACAGFIPSEDSWAVRLLREAGAVIVGKTNTPEFGASCYTENTVTAGPAVTPYDLGRYASGSSGGSATAVAAGLLPFAHASDGAGSIRTPAGTCHLVGFKPSRGLVGTAPASTFVATTTEGPLARTVTDAALLLDAMTARRAPGELYGSPAGGSFVRAVRRGLERPLRIAMWTDAGGSGALHVEVRSAVEATAHLLRALGHEVEERPVPAMLDEVTRNALEVWFASSVGMATMALVSDEKHHLLSPFTRHLISLTQRLSARDVLDAQAVLAQYASALLSALGEYDAALTPVTSDPPMPIGHFLAAGVDQVLTRMLDWSGHTPWVNLTGQPAVSLPASLTADGLPIGVQLVGQRGRDGLLLALSEQLEVARGWSDIHPPCWLG